MEVGGEVFYEPAIGGGPLTFWFQRVRELHRKRLYFHMNQARN